MRITARQMHLSMNSKLSQKKKTDVKLMAMTQAQNVGGDSHLGT